MNRKIIFYSVLAGFAIGAVLAWQSHFKNDDPMRGNTPNTAWLQPFATGLMANFIVNSRPTTPTNMPFVGEDGKTYRLSDFKSKIILVNMWATWCTPCREEMPSLDRLKSTLGGPDFDIVAISLDLAGMKVARAFFEEEEIQHLDLYLERTGGMHRALGSMGLPLTLVLDRNGYELGRMIGPAEWDSPEAVALIRAVIDRDKTGQSASSTDNLNK